MLIFRQLVDPQSSTYTYLLGDEKSGQAVLIDTVFEQVRRDAALISELGLKLVATIETHVHADHVTGSWMFKRQSGSAIVVAKASGAEGADRYVAHGDEIHFGGRYLQVRATPGHTDGCLTYVLDDESLVEHYQIPREHCWLAAAKDMGIPVFTPGFEDSTLGNIFAARVIDGSGSVHGFLFATEMVARR